tara:strand:- start:1097 stop:1339 length:243 start_codon:yes stop_codon:yes gene_type:complete
MSEKVWKKGHVWTRKHLETDVRLIDIRNFAKGKMAGLKDDVHDNDWGPMGDASLKDYLTGYHAAMDDLEKWTMAQVDDGE